MHGKVSLFPHFIFKVTAVEQLSLAEDKFRLLKG